MQVPLWATQRPAVLPGPGAVLPSEKPAKSPVLTLMQEWGPVRVARDISCIRSANCRCMRNLPALISHDVALVLQSTLRLTRWFGLPLEARCRVPQRPGDSERALPD